MERESATHRAHPFLRRRGCSLERSLRSTLRGEERGRRVLGPGVVFCVFEGQKDDESALRMWGWKRALKFIDRNRQNEKKKKKLTLTSSLNAYKQFAPRRRARLQSRPRPLGRKRRNSCVDGSGAATAAEEAEAAAKVISIVVELSRPPSRRRGAAASFRRVFFFFFFFFPSRDHHGAVLRLLCESE